MVIVHIFGKHGLIYSIFGVKNGTLYLAKKQRKNAMAHLENILALNLNLKNMTQKKTKWQLYKI